MAPIILPQQDYLAECFSYDPESGELRWLTRPRAHFKNDRAWRSSNKKYAGNIAGCPDSKGYSRATISGPGYLTSRIIWKLMTGDEPPAVVDHWDRDPTNNRWDNLRAANYGTNAWNRKAHKGSWSGLKGVYRDHGNIIARICVRGKDIYLGSFATPKEAHAAYCSAAREHFGEFWNPG